MGICPDVEPGHLRVRSLRRALACHMNVECDEGNQALTHRLKRTMDRSQPAFLGHPDGRLHRCKDELSEQVRRVLREFEPGEVLVTSDMDWHPDHCALFEVVAELMASEEGREAVRADPVWFWSARSWIGAAGARDVVTFRQPMASVTPPAQSARADRRLPGAQTLRARGVRDTDPPRGRRARVGVLRSSFLCEFLPAL